MRKLVLTLFFIYSLVGFAQVGNSADNIFSCFRAMKQGNMIVLSGKGYDIKVINKKKTGNFKKNPDNEKGRAFLHSEINMYSGVYLGTYDARSEGDMQILTSVDYKKNYAPCDVTVYGYSDNDQEYSIISFEKMNGVDYAFQEEMVYEIRNYGIPDDIFYTSKDTVDFFGQEIILPQGIKIGKDFRSGYTMNYPNKISGYADGVTVQWSVFDKTRDAELELDYLKNRDNYRPSYSTYHKNKVLASNADTVLFRGIPTTIYREDVQISKGFKQYSAESRYCFNARIDGKLVLLNITYRDDSLIYRRKLPTFVEENFISLYSDRPDAIAFIEDTIPVSDTIFIPQKNRFPISTFNQSNSRINGLSVGIFSNIIFEEKNVTTNGVMFEPIGSGVFSVFIVPQAVIMAPFALASSLKGGKSDSKDERMRIETEPAFDSSKAILNKNRGIKTNGISLSVTGAIEHTTIVTTNGLSIAGLTNGCDVVNGISVGGLCSMQSTMNGLQIGGLGNYAEKARGWQIGLVNIGHIKISGVQTGFYNTSHTIHGLQIGIFNNTKILKGFQIGLWNKNKKRSLPLINWGF